MDDFDDDLDEPTSRLGILGAKISGGVRCILEKISSKTPEGVLRFIDEHTVFVIVGGIAAFVLVNYSVSTILWKIRRKQRRQSYKKDVVVLHQFQRGRFAPSFSAFPLKLETYLRMVKIPYESSFEEPVGPKGKCPWITLNGEDVADSQCCVEFLNKKFNCNLNKCLNEEQRAASRAFRILVEEHLYWCVVLYAWHYDSSRQINNAVYSNFLFRAVVRPMVARMVVQSAYYHGIGRHSEEEVLDMGLADIRALSCFLGKKTYMLGNEPTELDSTVFGCLAIIMYNLPFSPYARLLNGDCVNLRDYTQRMREKYWPDWNYCLAPPNNLINTHSTPPTQKLSRN